MEQKKISFGFNKLSKKTNIVSNNVNKKENKVELIECLEGQSIKIKDAVEETKQPLVIPVKDNQKNLLDRIREAKRRERPLDQNKTEPEDNRQDSELSVDELAARQLIRDAKNRLAGNTTNENKVAILPLNNDTLSLEGEKEPTLEDYESVPISDYGLALLRGMGWKEGMAVGKNSSKSVSALSAPELRPKGLGLGATKVVQSEMPTKKAVDKDGEELTLVKGAFAKIIAGNKKGNYCEVQGFDEDAGRVIVKTCPKGEIVNLNEFMVVPVTKAEFSKGSKILNNAKYEEYLEISDKKLEKFRIKQEASKSNNIKKEYSENFDENSEEDNKDGIKDKKYKSYKKSPVSSDERNSRTRQRDGYTRNKHKSESSDSDYEQSSQKRTKSKYRDRSRSRSASRHKNKKDKNSRRSYSSSEAEHYEKERKRDKPSKSKYQDRSRDKSRSRDKYKKDKKHKSKQRRNSSSSDSDNKKDRRKKNKCKSRHRRTSSSSSTDRKSYKSKR